MEWSDLRPTLTVDLSSVRPLHDFVLVRFLGSANERTSDVILDPGNIRMTGDYRIMHNRSTGNRRGVVVAIGHGDRLIGMQCLSCGPLSATYRLETAKRLTCRYCGGELLFKRDIAGDPERKWLDIRRAAMHVAPGDIVIYPQIPVNDVVIDGSLYTWCHEEQHILAVVEASDYAEYKRWRAEIPEMKLRAHAYPTEFWLEEFGHGERNQ